MKKNIWILAALAALAMAGCNGSSSTTAEGAEPAKEGAAPAAALTAYELGTKKKGDKGVCVVCNKAEGMTAEEEVAETIDYEGKTYVFCNESEKADFISDPKKFVAAK